MLSFTREYVSINSAIFNEIADRIALTYSQACILWIEKVVNADMSERYETQKKINSFTEKQLFHGTSHNSINSICSEGFKSDCNKVSAYGKGTYFSSQASFSWNYMKTSQKDKDAEICYMFYTDVLVSSADTTVNNDQIVVVSNDNCIYPRYIIAFHKNAT